MSITKFNGILYGGDYCPEQWDEAVWVEDIRIMKEYEVNAVTLNVHSWCVIQPGDGPCDFTKMNSIIKLLTENGIQIIMATGTAALPNWLLQKYPEIMAQDRYGVRNKPAKRVNYCPNSLDYRREIRRMCGELARHYQNEPGIILWHLNNELEDHCYCAACAAAYRDWLKARFGSLEELNRRWNTMFWGHEYTDWNQISPPDYSNMIYRNVDGHGIDISTFPTETLEYLRFMSESYRECFEIEKEAIREYISDAVITNNFQYRQFHYDALSKPLDVVSYDSYPAKDQPAYETAFQYDLTRSLKGGDPFLIMEMSPNQASWQMCLPIKRPGEVSSIAVGALARGAESSMFFQIRRSRAGFEKFHGAMIEHSGRTDTRMGRELKELGRMLKGLGDTLLGSKVPARTAVLMDWDSRWGVEIPSGPQKETSYQKEVMYYYQWLHSRNIMTDIARPGSDLSVYGLVIAPMMYMLSETEAENIREYVRGGGTFITTYMSGMADRQDNIWLGGYPALLKDLLGLWVEESDALRNEERNTVVMNAPWLFGEYECGYLCDLIRLEGASVLGTYGRDFYQGTPCITEHSYGKGTAVYLGTKPDQRLVSRLIAHYCEACGIRPVLETPAGVEAVLRDSAGQNFLFLLNHGDSCETVKLDGTYRSLITGMVQNEVALPVKGYEILEQIG